MRLFDVEYDALVWQLLPVRLRKPVTFSWLKCLVTPVKYLYNLFTASRTNNLYRLNHNSQICYLEEALNDIFDPVGMGIYIIDGPFKDPLYTYLVPESKPLWIALVSEVGSTAYTAPEVLYTDAETALLGLCFIVMVPIAISFDTVRMKAVIDTYRLVGRNRYDIQTY